MSASEDTGTTAELEPGELERGRYVMALRPDRSLVIVRALGTCEQCRTHGCGEQQAEIVIPAMLIRMVQANRGAMARLRSVLGGTPMTELDQAGEDGGGGE